MARWLGVDITETSMRLALVRSTYRRTAIETLREERIADHETPSAALRAACAGLKADATATALAGSRGFFRQLGLPAAAQKELVNVLSFEVEATLPFELDDAVMDHRVLRSIAGVDLPHTLPILAAVAFTEEVRERIGLLVRGTGQEPQSVGLGPLPLANLARIIPAFRVIEPVAILDLDEDYADVVILRRGEPRFSRSLTRGTRGLPGTAGDLSRELRQTFGAWRVGGGEAIDTLFAVGQGRHTPGLEEFMRAELGLTVVDLPRPTLDGLTPEREAELPRYAKAISLALSLSRNAADLNLRQGPVEAQQSYQFLRDKTPLLAGLGAAIAVSFGFATFAEMRALDAEHISLAAQLESATEMSFGQKTSDPKAASAALEAAIGGKFDDPVPEMDAFDLLVELSERIPSEITHDIAELDYNRGAVVIKGIVATIDDAHTIASKMEEHDCFRDVNITRTTQLKNQDKQKYTLEFNVKCDSTGTTTAGKSGKNSKSGKSGKGGKTPAAKEAPGGQR